MRDTVFVRGGALRERHVSLALTVLEDVGCLYARAGNASSADGIDHVHGVVGARYREVECATVVDRQKAVDERWPCTFRDGDLRGPRIIATPECDAIPAILVALRARQSFIRLERDLGVRGTLPAVEHLTADHDRMQVEHDLLVDAGRQVDVPSKSPRTWWRNGDCLARSSIEDACEHTTIRHHHAAMQCGRRIRMA